MIKCGWLYATPKLPILTVTRICNISFSANGKFWKSNWRTRSFPTIIHALQSTLILPLYGLLFGGDAGGSAFGFPSPTEVHLGGAVGRSAFVTCASHRHFALSD